MAKEQDSDTLRMVFTLFRHGARGPLIFLPNDKNKDYWEHQQASLTNEGKQQAYKLGLWYRQHYDNFLPKIYNANDIYVYSTDTNRTLMTAQCVLAGMYEPIGHNRWHDSIQWQPIPVHTTSGDVDPHTALLASFSFDTIPIELCKTERYLNMHKISLEFKTAYEKWYQYFYGNEQMRLDRVLLSADNAHINQSNGLPVEIPPEIKDFPAFMLSVVNTLQLGCEILPFYRKLGSSILDVALNAFKENIEDKKQTKMYMYSVHDLNFFGLFSQLNINRPRTGYCGFITFELHQFTDGKFYVKLQHQTKYDSSLADLSIADDQLYCPLEQFETIVEECRLNKAQIYY